MDSCWQRIREESNRSVSFLSCSVHPFQGRPISPLTSSVHVADAREPVRASWFIQWARENLLLKLHISFTPGPHTLYFSGGGRDSSPPSSIFTLTFFLNAELRRWKVGTWSESSRNQNPTQKELTLVPSASTSPPPHPFPWTYKHTTFKIKWLSWQTKMSIIWMLPLLKNKWDYWSVLWHLLEIMFIIFMAMEMRGQLSESLTPRTCTLFAVSENFFPWRFKSFY